jgi:hypothetical protein
MRDVLIVLLIAVIIVVGGWKFWNYQQNLNGENVITTTEETATTTDSTTTDNGTTLDVTNVTTDTSSTSNPVIKIVPQTTKTDTVSNVASVSVSDQKAGTSVSVTEIALPASGWIAIRDYANGKMGNTLGAKLLSKGTQTNVVVELLRPMVAGNSYVAVPLKDNGDGLYKGTDDVPFNGADGKPVMTLFKAN